MIFGHSRTRHVLQLQNAQLQSLRQLIQSLVIFWSRSTFNFTSLVFEGDGVFTETVLSNGGRGRMPNFEGQYRALC